MAKTKNTYEESRYNDPFPKRLREEFCITSEDVKKLSEALDCSTQAVNQYRIGTAFPKVENMIKIARFYGCSLNYLIGASNVKSPDASIDAICEYTGLSEAAVDLLHYLKNSGMESERYTINFLNRVLSDPENAPEFKLVNTTLFSWMECYVRSSSVRALRKTFDFLPVSDNPDDEEGRSEVYIRTSDGVVMGFPIAGPFKSYIIEFIRDELDRYQREEEKK